MNVVVISGNLGRDPEIQATNSGKSVLRNSIAVRGYDGNPIWINITAWGKTAELIAQYFNKGNKIGVRGSLNTSKYDDKEGRTVYQTFVNVQEIDFMQNKSDNKQITPDYQGNMQDYF
jgi:single-strand DNA-binding protein